MARQAASIVADDNTVGVEHRHNFENVSITKYHGSVIVANKILDESLHDEWAVALTWMHPTSENNAFPLCYMILWALKIRDN